MQVIRQDRFAVGVDTLVLCDLANVPRLHSFLNIINLPRNGGSIHHYTTPCHVCFRQVISVHHCAQCPERAGSVGHFESIQPET